SSLVSVISEVIGESVAPVWSCCVSWFFFFSSRRRHTRSYGDWSSDVCSSDLWAAPLAPAVLVGTAVAVGTAVPVLVGPAVPVGRSEERRVGKECRSRGSPDH